MADIEKIEGPLWKVGPNYYRDEESAQIAHIFRQFGDKIRENGLIGPRGAANEVAAILLERPHEFLPLLEEADRLQKATGRRRNIE